MILSYGNLSTKNSGFSKFSKKKVEWDCSCGRKKEIRIQHVTSGKIKSCGRCNEVTSLRRGKLTLISLVPILPFSNKKVEFLCDCGKTKLIRMSSVTLGNQTSCGSCAVFPIEYWENRYFNKLRMKYPQDVSINSSKKVMWECKCGNDKEISVSSVIRGKTGSCGSCFQKALEWVSNQNFQNISFPTKIEEFPSGWMKPKQDILNLKKNFLAECFLW